MPDIKFKNEDMILKGDKLVNRWKMSGTNKRTRKRFSVTGMTIYQLEGGKLKGHWQNVDKLGLYQQLGMELKPKEEK
jgi:predicted ester cyclase